ncbi:MAG: restriction endonuclease subunit S [Rhodanobacter sp.]
MSWRTCMLGDVLTLKRGHDLPESARAPGDVPVVSSSGITGWHNTAMADPPGVVTGRYGTIGEVFFLDEPYWPLNTSLYVIDFKGNDAKYSAYLLRNTLRNYRSEKAAVPGVNRNVLHTLDVSVPDLLTQRKIVSTLSAYDDLIENNRRRIVMLEEAARLLYREWFGHFRFPGHEHAKFIDGLPEGWQRVPASQAFDVNPKMPKRDEPTIRYVPMAALSETGMLIDRAATEVRESASGARFQNGDTLLARITPCLENGKTGFVQLLDESEVACGSTEFIVLRGALVSNYFVYLASRQDDFRDNAIHSMIGSSGRQRVQASCFDRYMIAVPPGNLATLFDESVRPLFEQIGNLDQQNQELAQARDLLLPRLMSGELAA